MHQLFALSRYFERISSFVGRIAVWLLFALMLVIITDITLRRWFVIGSTKLQELEWHLHGALFLLCLGWAYTKNAHVRIELLSEHWSRRTAAKIELLGCVFLLIPYVMAVLSFGWDYVAYSIAYSEASASATGLPDRWIIKSMIVVGFGVLGLAALSRLFDSIIFLFGPEVIASKTHYSDTPHPEGAS